MFIAIGKNHFGVHVDQGLNFESEKERVVLLDKKCSPTTYRENLHRLECAVLHPPCLNDTKSDSNKPMVQVVPPCRSLCLEVFREIGCYWLSLGCIQFPKPRDVKFLCVPPVLH